MGRNLTGRIYRGIWDNGPWYKFNASELNDENNRIKADR